MLDRRREHRDEPDDLYREKVSHVIEEASQEKPVSTEDIERQNAQPPGGYRAAYQHFLSLKRSALSRRFLQIDESLEESFRVVRTEIGEVLSRDGQLPAKLFGDDDGEITLGVYEYLKSQFPQLVNLLSGFELLATFRIDYRGMIQHRIRKHLDLLDPKSEKQIALSDAPDAEEVAEALIAAYSETLSEIENALNDIETEPNLAIFAFVEEFFDQVCRAKDTRKEWSFLFHHVRADVWPDRFDQLEKNSAVHQRLSSAISKAREQSARHSLDFTDEN